MNILLWILYIILALFIGSFLNVVALRTPKGESVVSPSSYCTMCKHPLHATDLIPVFSYLFNRGKCRYCGGTISPIYLLGELLTSFVFIINVMLQPLSYEWIIFYPFVMVMIVSTLSDLKYHLVPDQVVYLGIGLTLVLRFLFHPLPFLDYLLGAFIGSGFLLILAILSRGGMGGGDIKLFFLIGLVLGWQQTLLAIFLSAFVGTIFGGVLIIFRVLKRKQFIPFVPFIFIGSLITYFLGNDILNYYFSFFTIR